ncbi:ACP S-malonyltransferase [Pseudoalteromonas sp. MMG013]|uniref:ACP S-malonyltransferase n=1 Tax=Pseudoalteromonas sp. MMG013 TaxID=2822687 RepID=UPI001FFC8FA4|nr:ACP S-malonyltransferase [Pseudoalteromonas sp. MMG013]
MMNTYLFPGQGSQYVGMGKTLFAQFPELTNLADKLLSYSIEQLCLNDTHKQLNKTQYTQPALFVVNALAYHQQIKQSGQSADFLAGHSLGEFNALYASGALSFEDALKLVIKRGELMSNAPQGAMAAILNIDETTLQSCLEHPQLRSIDIANFNSREQIVISGLAKNIAHSQAIIEQQGGRFIPLNTSGAFHSRYMADAQQQFAKVINNTVIKTMQTPVIANVTGLPYQPDDIKHHLIAQMTQPVKWNHSIQYLYAQGNMQFKELGPKKVLTKLVQNITQDIAQNSEQDTGRHSTRLDTNPLTTKSHVSPINTPVPAEQRQTETMLAKAEPSKLSPQQHVEYWNLHHPIGTQVLSITHVTSMTNPIMTTRSQATLIFGQRAVVYLHNFNGYFALDELQCI